MRLQCWFTFFFWSFWSFRFFRFFRFSSSLFAKWDVIIYRNDIRFRDDISGLVRHVRISPPTGQEGRQRSRYATDYHSICIESIAITAGLGTQLRYSCNQQRLGKESYFIFLFLFWPESMTQTDGSTEPRRTVRVKLRRRAASWPWRK